MPFIFFVYIFLFLFGLSLGSFLNVVIDRWPKDKSIRGRSKCDYCHKALGLGDLIPVISFLLLKGKCRYCHKKLSLQYSLVELSTGLLLVITFYFYRHFPPFLGQPSFLLQPFTLNGLLLSSLIFTLVLIPFFILIFMMDLKYGLILDQIILPAIGLTFFFYLFQVVYYGLQGYFGLMANPLGRFMASDKNYFYSLILRFSQPMIISVVTGVAVALFFVLLIIISRGRGLGQGDIRLGFWLGLLLGYPKIVPALFLSFVLGGLVGLFLVITGKRKFGETVPLAPFLMIGSYLALFFGNQIIIWYAQRFL